MKNILLPYVFLLTFFLLVSCDKEIIEPETTTNSTGLTGLVMGKRGNDSCTPAYYYYNSQQVNLGQPLTSKIVIGFRDGYTSEQKAAFVARYSSFNGIESEFNTGSADATIVLLKAGATCQSLTNIFEFLKNQPEVRYTGPFYNSPEGSGSLGIGNQFIVTLGAGVVISDLESLIRKTNTKVVEQLGDNVYILSADKTSTGNALEVANIFAEHSKVESAEPDFLYIFSANYSSSF